MKLEKRGHVPAVPVREAQSPPDLSQGLGQQLSPLRIANMTHSELQEILPKLVLAVQQQGSSRRRPDWWSHSVPWTQHSSGSTYKASSLANLRRAVQLCCSHLSQHTVRPSPAAQPRVIDWLNSNPPSRSCAQNTKACFGTSSPKHKGNTVPYREIYLCYLCGEEFPSKDTLQKHQVRCCGRSLSLSIPSTPPASEAPSPGPPTIASDDTSSSGGLTTTTSLPSSRSSSVGYHEYVAALDLVPVFRAKKIRQAQRRNTECETIDLEEPQTPISPSTPRTPKLLISQLSREASGGGGGGGGAGAGGEGTSSRRRLSYLRQSSEKKAEKPAADNETGSESESDVESCSTSSDDTDDPKVRKKSLLNIDLTSGLGQRVMKHITSEVHVPVIADVEQFCRTPIKDKYQDRLRVRQLCYPITYKLTRKRLRQQQHCHLYKFTREHKVEFMEKMRTGLNTECRDLLKAVKKCSVVVKRLSRKTLIKWKPSLNKISVSLKPLTAEEILYWTRPKPPSPVDASPSVFPTGPTFLLTDIDRVLGLKRKDGEPQGSCKLLASHFVSEAANAELQLQKLTVYRSLLTDLSSATLNGGELGVDSLYCQDHGSHDSGKKANMGKYGEKFPSLFSILSSGASSSKMARGKEVVRKSPEKQTDFKQPLKIEIPSPSVGPSHSTSRGSLPDDTISIRTTNSSDEESTRGGGCCAMCAVRSKCACSPPREGSISSRSLRSLQSPEQAALSPEHTPPLPLLSVGLASKSPMSSQQTLSPPLLSPMSQLSGSPSPGPSPRLTRASASHSPVSSPASQISCVSPAPSPRPSRHAPESPIPRTRRQVDAAETASPKSDTHNQRSVTLRQFQDQGDNATRRPSTRSNPKDVAVIRASAHGQQKRATSLYDSVLQSGDAKPVTVLRSSASLGTLPRTDIRSTRSGRVIGDVSTEDTGDLSANSHSQKGRNSRSGSRSSERNSIAGENGSADGSGGGEPVRILRSGNSVSNLSAKSDKSTASSRAQIRGEKVATGHSVHAENVAGLSQGDAGSVSPGSRSLENGNRLGTRSSARQLVHISSQSAAERNDGTCNFVGAMKATSSCETRGQIRPSDLSRKTDVNLMMPTQALTADNTTSVSSHVTPPTNPFLLSKAQTELFSSNIREQARRHWHVSHKSPERSSGFKGILRSGNSFRTASANMSPVSATKPEADAWQTGTVKADPVFSSSGMHSPTLKDHKKKTPPTSPSQHASPAVAGQPTSPARKRLSPLQMLSVLESTKSRHTVGSSQAFGKRKVALKRHKQGLSAQTVAGKRAAYPTRAKEVSNPAKKMRFSPSVE